MANSKTQNRIDSFSKEFESSIDYLIRDAGVRYKKEKDEDCFCFYISHMFEEQLLIIKNHFNSREYLLSTGILEYRDLIKIQIKIHEL